MDDLQKLVKKMGPRGGAREYVRQTGEAAGEMADREMAERVSRVVALYTDLDDQAGRLEGVVAQSEAIINHAKALVGLTDA